MAETCPPESWTPKSWTPKSWTPKTWTPKTWTPKTWTPMTPAASLWASTAEPLRAFPSLSGEVQADVAIIGAGYTGLSAAHHLAKSGLRPIVLEANCPGWGASGRNGGVITAKFRQSFRGIDASHGRAMAKRMYKIAHESVEIVEELVGEDIGGFQAILGGFAARREDRDVVSDQ